MEAEFEGFGARSDVVRAAEGGQEIVESSFVGQVYDGEAEAPLVAVAVEKIVMADGQVKKVPRLNARRTLVVILLAG